MINDSVTRIYPSDTKAIQQVIQLLESQGLTLDKNLDYIAAIYDGDTIIATGSAFKNSLRCFAINPNYKGNTLLNTLLTHLIDMQYSRGNDHLFIYTKTESAKFFKNLGFYEIATIQNIISFLENKRDGFKQYINQLKKESLPLITELTKKKNCTSEELQQNAIIINANPFTLGHLYLIETASKAADILHLFIVSEDSSLVPFTVRKQLIQLGTAHLNNIIYHECGPYMISNATFPGYFQKDEQHVIQSQAALDIEIFADIATALHISKRFVGSEPTSEVTNIYNHIMETELNKYNIEQVVLPRLEAKQPSNSSELKNSEHTITISASTVRQAIKEENWGLVNAMTPASTYNYFRSDDAKPIIDAIKKAENVIHH